MSEVLMRFIRPFITLVAVLGLTVGFFLDKVTADAYVPLMAMTIVYWFRSRDAEKEKENKSGKGKSRDETKQANHKE